jgi:xylan 1,4-beta-xylosidase
VPKPAFNAFVLLHKLSTERIPVNSDSVLATRRKDGALEIAVWNIALPEDSGTPKKMSIEIKGLTKTHTVTIYRMDPQHGSPLPAWDAMRKPRYPTQQQLESLRKAGALAPPESRALTDGRVTLTLPAQSLFLLEVK